MAITSNTYTGNGTNKLFSITFPYIDLTDIDVYLNGTLQTVTTQYTFANATTVEFVTAPGNGTTVVVQRSTQKENLNATFFPGSSIKAADLNDNFDQLLYISQENTDVVNNLPVTVTMLRWKKTATAGQTVLTGTDDNAISLAYTAGFEQVYVNGAHLTRSVDYTASDGGTITMAVALTVGDLVEVMAYTPTTTTTLSSAGVTFTQSGTGAVARNVDSKLKEVVSVKDFGAVGDGVADDTAAIQAAIALVGRTIFIPKGTYKVSATLVPACNILMGEGELASVITPTAAVTKVLSIGGGNYPTELRSFRINGVNTTNATGVYLGDAGSAAVLMTSVRCENFAGSSAYAFRVGDLLKSNLIKLTAGNCGNGFLIERTTSTFPTTVHLESCVATNCTGYGEKVVDGYAITHTNCIFESCQSGGVFILPRVSGEALEIGYDACWFEDNCNNNISQFHAVCQTTSGSTLRPWFKDCYFDTNTSTNAKSIKFDGVSNAGFIVNSPRFAGVATGCISVINGAYGWIGDWVGAYSYSTAVNDPNGTVVGLSKTNNDLAVERAAWTAYTPTYSSDLGNAATTFSGGTVTTSLARYKVIGKTLYITLTWSATLNAVTPSVIYVSIPAGLTLQNNSTYTPATVRNNTIVAGIVRTDGGNNLIFYNQAFAAYTSAASVAGFGSFVLELA